MFDQEKARRVYQKYVGSKNAREIAPEIGVNFSTLYSFARGERQGAASVEKLANWVGVEGEEREQFLSDLGHPPARKELTTEEMIFAAARQGAEEAFLRMRATLPHIKEGEANPGVALQEYTPTGAEFYQLGMNELMQKLGRPLPVANFDRENLTIVEAARMLEDIREKAEAGII